MPGESEYVCARCGLPVRMWFVGWIRMWFFGWKHSGGWHQTMGEKHKPEPVERNPSLPSEE